MSLILKYTAQAIKHQPGSCRSIFTTAPSLLDLKWREERRLPANPNAEGELLNYPDYTFMDGRPTPLGSRQMQRLKRHREMARKVVTLCKEIDFAKERYANIQREKELQKQKVLQEQLKPKGHLLLQK